MFTRALPFQAVVLAALCTTLLAAPATGIAQSVVQGQDVPHPQGVPRIQRVTHAPSVDNAQNTAQAQSELSLQAVTQLCKPVVTDNVIVATAEQRKKAGDAALPPLTDPADGFAWPDTELGVIRSEERRVGKECA